MPVLFAITLFVSAALLFGVQPMIAKLLLPLLGGASAVWTTCMVFYQLVLLAGYFYAHVVTNRFPKWLQVLLQMGLLTAAFLKLPFTITGVARDHLAAGAPPLGWLFGQLFMVAGLPFFVVSTTGPLLQRWFSKLEHSSSSDPYFLYGASNLGSLLALAAYPAWVEVGLDVHEQSHLWRWGFLGLAALVAICGWLLLRHRSVRRESMTTPSRETPGIAVGGGGISWNRRLHWVLLAFVPSSLMLGVTTYLTTDIASVPMLWIIPLGLYLVTFVIAFSRRQWLPAGLINWLVPVLAIVLIFGMLCQATDPVWLMMLCHLLFLFVAAVSCHARLAGDRPNVDRLTEFYLFLSVGGALGGLFNALVAPVLFREVIEYPLMIVVACSLYVPRRTNAAKTVSARMGLPVIGPGLLVIGLGLLAKRIDWFPKTEMAVVFGLPLIMCFALARRPIRFALALACVMAGGQVYVEMMRHTVFVARSFFGVSRVTISADGRFRQLDHGNTTHGRQYIDASRACDPLAYYHRSGPLGTIFREFDRTNVVPRVGLIGLGTGTTLAYSRPGQVWDVYEIDPLVIRIAHDQRLFSYLSCCSPVVPRIIEGDGRLQLARAPAGNYGMLILDAFSSDAIPTHLLTMEAVELYFSRIAAGGWLVLHVSNRYLDLEQVIAGIACARIRRIELDRQ